jgi:hypothetical protein
MPRRCKSLWPQRRRYIEGKGETVGCSVQAMMSAQLPLLASWLIAAIVLGIIAWRLWRRGKMRFSALETSLFKQTPEGWTFDSPYPRIFSRRRWTYLLTNAQKEMLTEGLRRCVRTAALMTIGFAILVAIPLAFWLPKLPDLLRWLLAGSPSVWLLLCLALVLVYGTLATAVLIAQKRWFHPVLRDARRIGPAGPLSALRLMAETTAVGELRRRIIGITLALLVCGLFACVTAYLSPPALDAELLVVMAVLFGLLDVWYVGVLVLKLRGERSPPGGPWGSSGSG